MVKVNILQACNDRVLFRPWFKNPTSWDSWFGFLRVLFGLRLNTADKALLKECTKRDHVPLKRFREAWLVCGRRGGKSFILALVAVYLACFYDFRKYLQPGERATIMIIAADRKQARIIFRYVSGLINNIPILKKRKAGRETVDGFDLKNSVTIEIHTASFRSTRGYTIVAALLDEIAFWRSEESANPDREILDAIRPGMATIPDAFLLCASSPYARKGVLWETHKKYFGKDDPDVLVWQAPTKTMNPSIPLSWLERQYERDPAAASAEYGAQFRSDVEALLSPELLDAITSWDTQEREAFAHIRYVAFVDPSGGSQDSFTCAIAHYDAQKGVTVLDVVRDIRPPFSPESVVEEYAVLLRKYNVSLVTGDRYAGEWPREQFAKRGIRYEVCTKSKSELYRDLVPLITARKCELLDVQKLRSQLVSLERRSSRVGKDSIDHPPHQHDDQANAVAGALVFCAPKIEHWDDSHIHVSGSLESSTFYNERDNWYHMRDY